MDSAKYGIAELLRRLSAERGHGVKSSDILELLFRYHYETRISILGRFSGERFASRNQFEMTFSDPPLT